MGRNFFDKIQFEIQDINIKKTFPKSPLYLSEVIKASFRYFFFYFIVPRFEKPDKNQNQGVVGYSTEIWD